MRALPQLASPCLAGISPHPSHRTLTPCGRARSPTRCRERIGQLTDAAANENRATCPQSCRMLVNWFWRSRNMVGSGAVLDGNRRTMALRALVFLRNR
jgi:hypothetical protein